MYVCMLWIQTHLLIHYLTDRNETYTNRQIKQQKNIQQSRSQLLKPTRKPSGRQKPPKNWTNSHILATFSVFTQPIFYLVKNRLHQCKVPTEFQSFKYMTSYDLLTIEIYDHLFVENFYIIHIYRSKINENQKYLLFTML